MRSSVLPSGRRLLGHHSDGGSDRHRAGPWRRFRLAINLRASAARFDAAKTLVVVGAGLGFLLWFTGFMVVGGEWFATWQSKAWNGQQAAFWFYMTLLAVVIFVNQPDAES